jgi:hypothetical protein
MDPGGNRFENSGWEQVCSSVFVKIPGILQSAIPFRLFAENSNE